MIHAKPLRRALCIACLLVVTGMSACSAPISDQNFVTLLNEKPQDISRLQNRIDGVLKDHPTQAVSLISQAFVTKNINRPELKQFLAYRLAGLTQRNSNKALLKTIENEPDHEVATDLAISMLCTYHSEIERLMLARSRQLEETKYYQAKLHHRSNLNLILAMIGSEKSKTALFAVIKKYDDAGVWLTRKDYELLGATQYKPAASYLLNVLKDKTRLFELRLSAFANLVKLDTVNKQMLTQLLEQIKSEIAVEYQDVKLTNADWPNSEVAQIEALINNRSSYAPAFNREGCRGD